MSAPARPKVPAAVKPVFDDIVSVTDLFCQQHLDTEYEVTRLFVHRH